MRQAKPNSSPLVARLWTGAVIALGLPAVVLAGVQLIAAGSSEWLWLGLAVALTSSLGIRIPLEKAGLGSLTITGSDCFTLLAIFVVDIWTAIALAFLDALITMLRMGVNSWNRKLFNISQICLTALIAGLAFKLLAPAMVTPMNKVLVVLCCGFVYFLTNATLFTWTVALHSGQSFSSIWSSHILPISPGWSFSLLGALAFSLPVFSFSSLPAIWFILLGCAGLALSGFYNRRAGSRTDLLA